MKFVKQILVGGLLLTALGQSGYAAEVEKEHECALEEQMRSLNKKLIDVMPAGFSEAEQKAFESLSTTVKKVMVSAEEQAASFLDSSIFKFFSNYTPAFASTGMKSAQGYAYNFLMVGICLADKANGFAKRMAVSLKPANQEVVKEKSSQK